MSSTPDQLTRQSNTLSIITYRILVNGKSVNPFLDFCIFFSNLIFIWTEPALVLALRGIDAFRRLEAVVPLAQPGRGKDSHIDYIMSRNAEESYGFARAFFTDKEIFSDPTARHLLMYLPQVRHHIQGFGSR